MLPTLYIVLIPILFGLLTSLICPISKSSGGNVKIRPPSYVFGITWSILYILLGVSWYYLIKDSNNKFYLSIPYLILLFFLFLFIVIYSCKNNKIGSVYVLFMTILIIIECMIIGNTPSRVFITPLLVWIIFASLLNIFEIEKF